MPRVYHIKKARKPRPEHGIEKGDSYYYWGFAFGPKCYSKTYPKPQQLTRSEFWIQVYDFQDILKDLDAESLDKDTLESLASDITSYAEEIRDRHSNMPEGLQSGPTGELLEERADALEEWARELECAEIPEKDEFEDEEEWLDAMQTAVAEAQDYEVCCG